MDLSCLMHSYAHETDTDAAKTIRRRIDELRRRTYGIWPWQKPIWEDHNEVYIAGSSSFGAYLGYDVVARNIFTDAHTLMFARTFARAVFLNKASLCLIVFLNMKLTPNFDFTKLI
jgi:hypothetical protein